MKRNVIKALAASAVFTLGVAGAHAAANDPTSLDIKLTITGGCTVDFDGQQKGISLGIFNNLLESATYESNAIVRCNAGSEEEVGKEYRVELDQGVHSEGARRQLALYDAEVGGFTNFIKYDVYQGDNALSTRKPWKTGSDAIVGTVEAVQFAKSHRFAIEVPAVTETPPVGVYTDVLRATVIY